jgi:4'-phosphopantetheinyl transferase
MKVTTTTQQDLRHGQVDLWFFDTEDRRLDRETSQYEAVLSDDERQHCQQLNNPQQQREFLLGRATLRKVLASYCDTSAQDLAFCVNAYGKPQLEGSLAETLKFNVARSNGFSICAVASQEVGVDIESHPESAGMLDAADDYLSKTELQALRSQPAADQLQLFFRYWTLKEAWLKARGKGLSVPLHDFSILLKDGQFDTFDGPEAGDWDCRLLAQNDDLTAALALNGKIDQLSCYRFSPAGERIEIDGPDQAVAELISEGKAFHQRWA